MLVNFYVRLFRFLDLSKFNHIYLFLTFERPQDFFDLPLFIIYNKISFRFFSFRSRLLKLE